MIRRLVLTTVAALSLGGLAACGAHLALGVVSGHAQQGHPLIPALQVAEAKDAGTLPADDIDLFLRGDVAADEAILWRNIAAIVRGERLPVATARGFVDFQLTRGLLGVTT